MLERMWESKVNNEEERNAIRESVREENKCEADRNQEVFPGGPVVRSLPCNAGDTRSTPHARGNPACVP